ncbi:hypothetical protein [Vibrio paucivorans]|uniref:Uncharacterized protein n=1 Tax=Vibrio paucivorans TaxID=2829489 RepID=A0A9X3CII8_9VIBR|nr:hypothetical protein [Vibrio paucivorans]MCW8336469.1 hypothetical protein [Vibrio paucivorans]
MPETKKGRGRPKISNPKTPFSCLLHEEDQELIKRTAKSLSCSKADVVKQALQSLKSEVNHA